MLAWQCCSEGVQHLLLEDQVLLVHVQHTLQQGCRFRLRQDVEHSHAATLCCYWASNSNSRTGCYSSCAGATVALWCC